VIAQGQLAFIWSRWAWRPSKETLRACRHRTNILMYASPLHPSSHQKQHLARTITVLGSEMTGAKRRPWSVLR